MSVSFLDGREPADTHEEIMHATYDALQKYGYAGLSIQRIADQSDLSKSSFYHHFDGKEDILLSFAEYILTNFKRAFEYESADDPEADLKTFLALIVGEYPGPDQSAVDEMLGTYLELRSQAVHDRQYRETFTRTSTEYVENLAAIIEDGIEQGVFADVDPRETASFLLTIADGIILHKTTRTDDPGPMLYETLEGYVDSHLLADTE